MPGETTLRRKETMDDLPPFHSGRPERLREERVVAEVDHRSTGSLDDKVEKRLQLGGAETGRRPCPPFE